MQKIFMTVAGLGLALLLLPTAAAKAQTPSSQPHASQPYAGQDQRQIKSLSARDIDDLLNGRGWGLAKAAELNGLPGPTHVLELRAEMKLTEPQMAAIQELFDDMKKQAIPHGVRLVEQERQLDLGFAAGDMSEARLKRQLAEIAGTLAELRFVHLATHLKTVDVLTKDQILIYNKLRGYQTAPGDRKAGGHTHTGH